MKLIPTNKGKCKATLDETGKIILDVPCPVHCGACCVSWKKATAFKIILKELVDVWECPFRGIDSCSLPRSQQPIECTTHLCELGELALEGKVTPEEIQRVCSAIRQNDARTFLGEKAKRFESPACQAQIEKIAEDIDRQIIAEMTYRCREKP